MTQLLAILLIAVASLTPGIANAQSMFTAPGNDADLAQALIQFLTNGNADGAAQITQTVLSTSAIQTAVKQSMALLSKALFVAAIILLIYHFVRILAETARTGKPFGDANEVWAPIRLVVAIGLLTPLGAGYDTAQLIVIKAAEMGSGLASQTWSTFLTSLSQQTNHGKAPVIAVTRNVVDAVVMMEACKQAFNAYNNGVPGAAITPSPSEPINMINPLKASTMGVAPAVANGSSTVYDYKIITGPETIAQTDYCGHYTFHTPPAVIPNDPISATTRAAVIATATPAFQTMQQQVAQFVQTNIPYFVSQYVGGKDNLPRPSYGGDIENIVSSYNAALNAGFSQPDLSGVFANSAQMGWISAGAFYSAVGRAQLEALEVGDVVPDVKPPDLSTSHGQIVDENVTPAVQAFQRWINLQSTSTATDSPSAKFSEPNFQADRKESEDWLDYAFNGIDIIASQNGVWSQGSSSSPDTTVLGVQFDGGDPMAALTAFGKANFDSGLQTFKFYLGFKAASGVFGLASGASSLFDLPMSKGFDLLSSATSGLAAVTYPVVFLFIACGIAIAYVLPVMPFLVFLFAGIRWLASFAKCLVLSPFWALAHVASFGGDDLPGNYGKNGYIYIFELMVRPVLCVIGLIVSLLLFYAGVALMNYFYPLVVRIAGGTGDGHIFLSRFIFTIIYVITVYHLATASLKLVDAIPDHAMQWLGVSGQGTPDMRPSDRLEAGLTAGSSFVEQSVNKGMTGANAGLRSGGRAAGRIFKIMGENKERTDAPSGSSDGGGAAANAQQSTGDVSAKRLPDFGLASPEQKKE